MFSVLYFKPLAESKVSENNIFKCPVRETHPVEAFARREHVVHAADKIEPVLFIIFLLVCLLTY